MENKPIVLICSNTKTKPETLMKRIFNPTSIDEESPDMVKSNWNVITKYYSAEICLVGLEKDIERSEDFNDRVEALIIHLDPETKTWVEDLDAWKNIMQDCKPEIQLLVTDYENEACSELIFESNPKTKSNLEIVPLFENSEPNQDEASDFQEKTGIDRVIEVLHSHKWPNMKKTTLKKKVYDLDDSFEEMFAQLSSMKESITSLPSSERKQCAEQIVTQFWKAIGGDEDELSDSENIIALN